MTSIFNYVDKKVFIKLFPSSTSTLCLAACISLSMLPVSSIAKASVVPDINSNRIPKRLSPISSRKLYKKIFVRICSNT